MLSRLFLLPFALILMSVPVQAAGDVSDHRTDAGGVSIVHGWARATESGSTQVFMELFNGSDAQITLNGARMRETGLTATVMGAPVKAGDAPAMLGNLPIPAGTAFDLDPGGVYLLLTGLPGPLARGDRFALLLDLEPVGEVEIIVDVEAENAMQHSHAGHAH